MDASTDVNASRTRLAHALYGLLLLGLWLGWAIPALCYQAALSPIPPCAALKRPQPTTYPAVHAKRSLAHVRTASHR